MAANLFKLEGKKVCSKEDLYHLINNNHLENVLYMPDILEGEQGQDTFQSTCFFQVSFKKTLIKFYTFKDCKFKRCLFLATEFEKCKFSNCEFIDCNFLGSKWREGTRINPLTLKKNFDYINDANIATELFQKLYELNSKSHQIGYQKDSKYLFRKSRSGLTYYYRKEKRIGRARHWWNIVSAKAHDFISGYGVYRSRIIIAVLVYVFFLSIINFFSQGYMFDSNYKEMNFMDIFYFTFITITTIGFGDIVPKTSIGKMIIVVESSIGIMLIAYSLNVFSKNTDE